MTSPTVRPLFRVLALILAICGGYVCGMFLKMFWEYGYPTVQPFMFILVTVTSGGTAAVMAFVAAVGRAPKWMEPRARGTRIE
ncbi:hypothetical protein BWI17_21475 [Betaproteobacteria bacterium GR16-43]|nr:hypothetical protein BWI17_21475 [Betaproteobacteria bacterium GR16-43]